MFFFGLASNFITLSILGVFSVVFLYQGVKDVTHIYHEHNTTENIVLGQDIQQNISFTDFQLTFADSQSDQDELLIYPKFVHIDYPDCVESLPEKLSNQNISRGPPSRA
jgi:hypothetical protein